MTRASPGARAALLLGLAGVILVLLFACWRLFAPAAGGTLASAEAQAPAEVELAGVERAGDPAGAAPELVDVPSQAGRGALAPGGASAPTSRLRVVLAASGAPVPEARLWLQREEVEWTSREWSRAMRRCNDVEPVLQGGLGRELALDARGAVLVPRPARALSVAAAHGALHGEATLRPEDAECVLELRPYRSLAVEVVDRAGRPVEGAFVALYWGAFDPLEHGWAWIADTEGRVWVPKLESVIWPDGYSGSLRLSLGGGVRGEPDVLLFGTDDVPAEPVRFVAQDSGSVVVQLTDPQGRELALDGYAYLEIAAYKIPDAALALRGGASLHLPLEAGRAVFARVGLDLPLEISVTAQGHANAWREAHGPTTPGEVVRVLVAVGERAVSVRGRVFGLPAAFGAAETPGARLRGRAPAGFGQFDDWVLEGEAFERPLWSASELDGLGGPWTLELTREGGPNLSANVTPVLDLESHSVDFGDVRFEPLPVLACVRVLDDLGAAVAGAELETRPALFTGMLRCAADGTCQIAGSPARLPLEVRAAQRAWLPSAWARIEAPGGDCTLVVRRGAALVGSLLLPRAANLDDFWVVLRVPSGAAGGRPAERETEVVEGGRFRFGVSEPGSASLAVTWADRPVFELAGIELTAGETRTLAPLDLRAVLHPIELTFELAGGAPWQGGHLELRELDGELTAWTTIGPAARAAVLALRPSVDVWVGAQGARPRLFEGVRDRDHLVLPRAPAVVLRLPRGLRCPEPPLVLLVRGERVSPAAVEFEADEDTDVADAVFGSDGSASLEVPWPGEYELAWAVRHAGTGAEFALECSEIQVIQVSESPGAPAIEARFESSALERAVQEAGG